MALKDFCSRECEIHFACLNAADLRDQIEFRIHGTHPGGKRFLTWKPSEGAYTHVGGRDEGSNNWEDRAYVWRMKVKDPNTLAFSVWVRDTETEVDQVVGQYVGAFIARVLAQMRDQVISVRVQGV